MKLISLQFITLLVAIMSMLISCESDKREEIKLSSLPDTIHFSEHISPIFNGTCIKCHNGQTPPDLSQDNAYIELTGGGYINTDIPEDSRLYNAIKEGGIMSQYANELDRAYVLKWIQQGAFEN